MDEDDDTETSTPSVQSTPTITSPSASASASASSRRAFTIQEKLVIISRLQNGESNLDISKEFNVRHSTVSTIWKNRHKIIQCFEKRSLKIKKLRTADHEDIEGSLLLWVKAHRIRNIPVSRSALRQKANDFARLLGKTNFRCSDSWIYRFRQRYEIPVEKSCSEIVFLFQSDYEEWLNNIFPKLREGYGDSQVFNANETCLLYKMTPDRTLQFKVDQSGKGVNSEDRMTILLAANMDGSVKRKLSIISNFKPSFLNNVKKSPVDYEVSERSSITSELFAKALHTWDCELKDENKKIFLFVDNVSVHQNVQGLTNIKIAFLPPHSSTKQPMNQGIIKCFKSHYRKQLVLKIIDCVNGDIDAFDVNMLEVIEMVATAWERVSSETIKKCFENAGYPLIDNTLLKTSNEDDCDGELDSLPLEQLTKIWTKEENFIDWETYIDVDSQAATAVTPEEENIENEDSVSAPNCSSSKDNGGECVILKSELDERTSNIPSVRDALNALSTLKQFAFFSDEKNTLPIEWLIKMERTLESIHYY